MPSCWLETGHRSCSHSSREDYTRVWLQREILGSCLRACPPHFISRSCPFLLLSASTVFVWSFIISCLNYCNSFLVWYYTSTKLGLVHLTAVQFQYSSNTAVKLYCTPKLFVVPHCLIKYKWPSALHSRLFSKWP